MDTILSIQVMCAVNDPRPIMKEIWKLLKPGGQFIFWEHGKSKDTVTSIAQSMFTSRHVNSQCNIEANQQQRCGILHGAPLWAAMSTETFEAPFWPQESGRALRTLRRRMITSRFCPEFGASW